MKTQLEIFQTFHADLFFLTNFEIQKYYQNEPKFDVVYSVNNLAK